MSAFSAELLKLRRSKVVPGTFIAFALASLMGAVFMLILGDPEAMARAGALQSKAEVMGVSADWWSYLLIVDQAMAVGGVMVFGFVASWLFGREYSDGTAKDLLALPTSRTRILHAKFMVYALWCLALAVSNLAIAAVAGSIMQLPVIDGSDIGTYLPRHAITILMVIALGTPIAFFALKGGGYLMPLAFLALTLVLSQVVAAAGYGSWFPWSIPGLWSGAGGEMGKYIDGWSFVSLAVTSVLGYIGTMMWWDHVDQMK